MHRIERLNIINSVTGIKPANLIGTISDAGIPNLAIFSSVVHLGSNPAIVGFMVRPQQEVRRHTYENIMHNGLYSINHVHANFAERAHYTSAKFDAEISEFVSCGLTEQYIEGFAAPFVQESRLKLGMRFLEAIPVQINNTHMIVGEILHAIIPDEAIEDHGHLDLTQVGSIGISGLNSYYQLEKIGKYPYARPHQLPDFDESAS